MKRLGASAVVVLLILRGGAACSNHYEEPDEDAGADVFVPDVRRDVVTDRAAPVPDAGPEDVFVPPPIDAGTAFDFALPYAASLGAPTRSDAGHKTAKTPPSNPADTPCLDCHKDGGTAGNMPFFAGGTVRYISDGGPAAMAEVRVKAYASSLAVSAYTDNDGNWFIPLASAQAAGLTFAVRPGVRNGSITRVMGASPAIGNCNNCHSGSQKL